MNSIKNIKPDEIYCPYCGSRKYSPDCYGYGDWECDVCHNRFHNQYLIYLEEQERKRQYKYSPMKNNNVPKTGTLGYIISILISLILIAVVYIMNIY